MMQANIHFQGHILGGFGAVAPQGYLRGIEKGKEERKEKGKKGTKREKIGNST